MRYFDFHCHVLLKQLFAEVPNIDTQFGGRDVSFVPRHCSDLPNILQTQIHQSQLASLTDEVLVGVALYGLESYLAEEVLKLRNFLRPDSRGKMWEPLIRDMARLTAPPYPMFNDFTVQRTLNQYLRAGTSFNVVDGKSFSNPLPTNKVNIFFQVEGCHSLVNTSVEAGQPGKTFPPAEILANLDKLRSLAPVLSVNLTHLQHSNLCNHSFGIQLTGDKAFRPKGNGLTNDGRAVVQGLFNRGIAVDVKHMSLKSRLDLYRDIDAGRFGKAGTVSCTHAGFTGTTVNNWPGYILAKRAVGDVYYLEVAKTMHTRNYPRRPGAPTFNMTTINLFDDEIVWIVRNGGMIGLSMDRRILGFVHPFDDRPTGRSPYLPFYVDKEYIAKDEWAALNTGNRLGYLVSDQDCITEDEVKESIENIPQRNDFYYHHIMLQLKHFLQVCVDAGIPLQQAQRQITIGSDFDGLINPFINIASVEDMPDLRRYLLANFGRYLSSLRDAARWYKQLDVPVFVEGFFYENGYRFVKNFFVSA